jgi:hypothetical protein
MRQTLLFASLLLLGIQAASAAAITANITANVLQPVNIAFHTAGDDNAMHRAGNLEIHSSRDLHFELSHQDSDVCLLGGNRPSGNKLALASCETYTINFN